LETKNYFSTDAAGNILPSATVYVYNAGTTDLASGIANINGAALSNPFTALPSGLVQFQAPDGEYDLRVTKGGRDFSIRIQAFDGVSFKDYADGSFSKISALSADTGSTLIGFRRTENGAVPRTINQKELERCTVQDFGVVGNNIVDDTQAFQRAIDAVGLAGGGDLWIPSAKTFKLSGPLEMPKESVRLVGASRFSSLFMQYALDSKILNVVGNFCNIEHLGFAYANTPLLGGTAIDCSGSYVSVDDIVVRRAHKGIRWHEGVAGKITNLDLLNYEAVGLEVQNLNDLFLSRFIFNAGNQDRGTLGGIRLLDKVEAFICEAGDILLGQYSMTSDAASNTIGLELIVPPSREV